MPFHLSTEEWRVFLLLIVLIVSQRRIYASKCPCTFPGFPTDTSTRSNQNHENNNNNNKGSDPATTLPSSPNEQSFKLFLHSHERLQVCTSETFYQELYKIEIGHSPAAMNAAAAAAADPSSSSSLTTTSSITRRNKRKANPGDDLSIFHLNHTLLKIIPLASTTEATSATCDIFLQISSQSLSSLTKSRRICPDQCSPVPILTIPRELLLPSYETVKEDYAITCSMTFARELFPKFTRFRRDHPSFGWLSYILYETGLRRYYECHEASALYRYALSHHLHPYINDTNTYLTSSFKHHHNFRKLSSKPTKRRIRGMVVWIGTKAKYSLMRDQALVLANEPFHLPNSIIGWAATDDLYPCPPHTVKCHSSNKKYGGVLPATNINLMSEGWGCAQRRPLRALSHILLFFTMDFLILIDDDTFFNYSLFAKKYLSQYFLLSSSSSSSSSSADVSSLRLQRKAVYYGEALGATGDRGHVSKEGFFVGGSGYIFNRKVLERLVRKEVIYFGWESLLYGNDPRPPKQNLFKENLPVKNDPYRSDYHQQKLSLLQEGLEYSEKYCSVYGNLTDIEIQTKDNTRSNPKYACIYPMEKPRSKTSPRNDTVGFDDLSDQFSRVPLGIRLIDFCSNLMANENTCQHSDHSVGRCLIYGVGASPVNVPCHLEVKPLEGSATNNSGVLSLIGMCFMSPQCDLDEQITCHRYKATLNDQGQVIAEKIIPTGSKNYRMYSSIFNGESIESKL